MHPFCSTRCANVDLLRWLGGRYQIAANEDEDEDGERAEPATKESLRHEDE